MAPKVTIQEEEPPVPQVEPEPPRVLVQCCRGFTQLMLRVIPVLLLVGLTFLGGFLMHVIEEKHEIRIQKEKWERKMELREKQDLEPHEFAPAKTKWDFWSSVFYTMTLYTTNGFANLAPMTSGGRTVSVVWLFVCIPLLIFTLYLLGYYLSRLLLWLHSVYLRVCCCWRNGKWQLLGNDDVFQIKLEHKLSDVAFVFPIWATILALIAVFLIIPLFILHKLEPGEERDLEGNTTISPATYEDSLWYFTTLVFTVGFFNYGPPDAEYGIFDMIMVLLFFLLVACLIHLISAKLDAVARQLELAIDERYRRALVAGESARMPTDQSAVRKSLRALITRTMPRCQRVWTYFLGCSRKEKLSDHWLRRAKMQCSDCQTLEGSFEPRMYGIGSVREEFRKSRDDINSLVAALDYGLKPKIKNRVYKS